MHIVPEDTVRQERGCHCARPAGFDSRPAEVQACKRLVFSERIR